MLKKITVGTRKSGLALAQASIVHDLLIKQYPKLEVEICKISTTGDNMLEHSLSQIGGKGLFTKEIEEHLLDGSIDIAVHSMKDMPAFLPKELEICCVTKRENPLDALISKKYRSIDEIPQNGIVGTSSVRRASQLLNIRPDIKIMPFRGNIHTRLKKIEGQQIDASFLAMAGIKRAGIEFDHISPIDSNIMLPAVAQGAIGIEVRSKDKNVKKLLEPINDVQTSICISAERAFAQVFGGNCQTPIAAHAYVKDDKIIIDCMIAKPDGSTIYKNSKTSNVEKAIKIGRSCALELKKLIDDDFFELQ